MAENVRPPTESNSVGFIHTPTSYASNEELSFLAPAQTKIEPDYLVELDRPKDVPAYYDIVLNYRLDPAKGGDELIWGGTFAQMRRKYEEVEVRVKNARGLEHEFSLDTTGFQFEHFPTSYKNFPWSPVDKELNEVYNKECEAFIRKITRCTDLCTIGHIIRQRSWDTDPEEDKKKPDMAMTDGGLLSARFVHIDHSDLGARRRLYDDMPPGEGALHDGKHRWAIINLWRPFERVRREPLGLCDARSVRDDELHNTMHCVPFRWPNKPTENHMWQIAPPRSLDQHKWWFWNAMDQDEVVLIKIFDSKKDGKTARRAPHSAFPTPDGVGPPRRSIETRFFVFWEDQPFE